MFNYNPQNLLLVDMKGKVKQTSSFKLYGRYKVVSITLFILLSLMMRNGIVLNRNNNILTNQLSIERDSRLRLEEDLKDLINKQSDIEKKVIEILEEE